MSSSVSNKVKPRQKAKQANSKLDSKTELVSVKPNPQPVKAAVQRNRRSLSLSKNNQVKESPQKSRSVDRSLSNRANSQSISVKNSLVDTKKTNINNKKNASSSNTLKTSSIRKSDSKINNSSSQSSRSSDRTSRAPVKGPSGKTNAEIAKSFVHNAAKTNKVIKSSINKRPDKKKSEKFSENVVEETDRPRTSTIRKGPPDVKDLLPENAKNLESNQNLEDPSLKKSESPIISDDDKASYEEDFEDYDSDFEESDSESVSYTSSSESVADEEEHILDSGIDRNSISGNSYILPANQNKPDSSRSEDSENKKNNEKTFLRMSDRSFLSSNKAADTAIEKKIIKSSHSFINFASAVEQEEKTKYTNRVLKRASDLLDIVTLSDVFFNQIDIPPMKYDTYIRLFGKNDYKQVFVQTENYEDEEGQTDEIHMSNKWTQNPPNDNFGFGGDKLENDVEGKNSLQSLFNSQNVKLSSFVQNCSKVFLTLLDEEFPVSNHVQAPERRNELFYSDGYYTLTPPSFLKDIPVLNVHCSYEFSHYTLTIHDGIIKVPITNDERGVICIWNFINNQKPEIILVAHSQPSCATFGPDGNEIIIAGMVDGTVLLWDLSDASHSGSDKNISLKSPTYSTAVILGKENHHSCIVAIQALIGSMKTVTASTNFAKTNSSRNFHVLTLEDMGIINIWVVVEVFNPDFSGLDTDLGLAPGGKLRLVRSSTLLLYDISALPEIQKINIRTFDFRLVPFDSNRILVTTDAGIVLHVSRQGGSADPRFYSNDLEFSSEVRCIVCSPHNEDLFLVGCSDGSVILYDLKLVRPVKVFLLAAKGDPVTLIQWSPIHPALFMVLSSSSSLHLWNLMEDSLHPANSYHFSDTRVTWFTFCKFQDPSNQKASQNVLHMFISRDDGEIEVHIFKHSVTEAEYSKQLEFMQNL